jgi:hypothetical protein
MSVRLRTTLGFMIVIVAVAFSPLLLSPSAQAGQASRERADSAVVTAWNAIAVRTIFTENATPIPLSGLYFGFTSVAVFDAVVAIEGRYRPYVYQGRAPAHASAKVAAATAAHRVLVHYFPASTPALDADYTAFLAGVPDGSAKTGGRTVGEASAAVVIAVRANDGRNAPITLDVTPGPGVWRPTPPAFAPMLVPWLAFVRPLALRSPEQISLSGPRELTSAGYARDWQEAKAYGAKVGSSRTPAQTETALFWNANAVAQYQVSLADRLNRHPVSIAAGARAFALLGVGTADSLITCWGAKYQYATWRPITAIQLADTDGNPATTADPSWEPLVATPPYPEYASGHACITGAATHVFGYLFGQRSIDMNIGSSVTGTTRHFESVKALDAETQNARIWLGLHFRRAMDDGSRIGHSASAWVVSREFRPTCGGRHH